MGLPGSGRCTGRPLTRRDAAARHTAEGWAAMPPAKGQVGLRVARLGTGGLERRSTPASGCSVLLWIPPARTRGSGPTTGLSTRHRSPFVRAAWVWPQGDRLLLTRGHLALGPSLLQARFHQGARLSPPRFGGCPVSGFPPPRSRNRRVSGFPQSPARGCQGPGVPLPRSDQGCRGLRTGREDRSCAPALRHGRGPRRCVWDVSVPVDCVTHVPCGDPVSTLRSTAGVPCRTHGSRDGDRRRPAHPLSVASPSHRVRDNKTNSYVRSWTAVPTPWCASATGPSTAARRLNLATPTQPLGR